MTNMTGTDKTQNARRYMRFGIILAAPFFLFNPVYAVIDPLPDWIGYVILCVALSRFCDVNVHFDSAHRSFFRLALVDALKPFSVIVIFAGMDLSERSTMMLLATFVFAVVELLLAVPGFNDLFEGITVFSESGGGTEALKGNRTRTVRIMTTVFLIVREALACLPEFAVLSGQGYDDSRFDWSVFTAFFRTAAIMLWDESSTRSNLRSKLCRNQMMTDAQKITVNALTMKSLAFSKRSIRVVLNPGIL